MYRQLIVGIFVAATLCCSLEAWAAESNDATRQDSVVEHPPADSNTIRIPKPATGNTPPPPVTTLGNPTSDKPSGVTDEHIGRDRDSGNEGRAALP